MSAAETFDYVIVGGGTAGSVLANRLTEDPGTTVCVIEGGPSDVGLERVLRLRNWLDLLGGDLDYDYPTVEQPRGNSHIRHSRARVLGGCSSHNTLISFRPFARDLDEWVAAGAAGWDNATVQSYADRIRCNIVPVAPKDRNDLVKDWITASAKATGVPIVEDFNALTSHGGGFHDGVGFLSVAYDPYSGHRSSASVAYLHPVIGRRANLTLLTETWAGRLVLTGDRATGVEVRTPSGERKVVAAEREVVLCAGAIDTPRLLLHSGIGPAADLRAVGVGVRHDLPGVGEHLLDHPESIIMWETHGPVPENTVMDSDAALFVRRDTRDPRPDLMFHIYQIPFADNTARLGYDVPEHAICMTPNIPRSRSRGRLWLTSSDPAVKPALDFRYFTDPDGYDARTIVDGLKIAREIAATEPFRSWLKREVAPGPAVTGDEALSEYGRRAAHTVYHPAGTCKMGAADDPTAVVDPELRVRGLRGLRVADASVFPTMPSPNPMVTVLAIGERAADLIRAG
ncbi:GMC family oxidoreductase [Marinitenerispora sediminis]|uniref:Oxidoreductase n=1 Tax=Marinitenerispora sediminis TaxID=1931232 RepID=A0A368TB38_9ACTN|nr:GMC oxidoreductase [Marinitenerispora sediminis]RCV50783.1 oxidoreductase [Marinitenerispora sediminis]RCV55040.1 oxidoreductase [Marinitenerispora sediminis]RCV62079.1 oxidoreductase [Marinitenerispora sediminis]